MKLFKLFVGLCLLGCSGNVIGAADDLFNLSEKEIEEAIQYGKNADYELNDFGGYDLGLNKYSLGDETGYLDIVTPFARIAAISLKMEKSGQSLSLEEARDQLKRPVELRVFLNVSKDKLEEPVACVVASSRGSIDISDNVMEFSMCDDDTGDCVRSLVYLLPTQEIIGERSFRIILRGETLAERNIEIETHHIR